VLMEKLSAKRKLLAALVMTAGLASLISSLSVPLAGRQTAQGKTCAFGKLEGVMVPLELGIPPKSLGNKADAECFLDALHAMLGADNLFLISYSSLNFVLFLFLVGSGRLRPAALWCLAGTILSVVMLVGDAFENRALYQWIAQARSTLGSGSPSFPMPPPSFLAPATESKWIALAVASLLCGVAYLFHRPWFLKLLILPGAVCAVLFWMGVHPHNPDRILSGMKWLIGLWTGGLLHSVLVALEQASPVSRRSVEKGGPAHV
jgi:hypothetical protein